MHKGTKRVHRLVVLPEYQGIGVGTTFITEIARQYKIKGYDIILTTTTPALVYSLHNNTEWGLIRKSRMNNGFDKLIINDTLQNTCSTGRITCSFKYTPSFKVQTVIQ